MSDEYLWDGSGPPDPDVQRLERLLGPLRTTAGAADPQIVRAPTCRLEADATINTVRLKAHTTDDTYDTYDSRPLGGWRTVGFLAPTLAAAAASCSWSASRGRERGRGIVAGRQHPRRAADRMGVLAGKGRLAVGRRSHRRGVDARSRSAQSAKSPSARTRACGSSIRATRTISSRSKADGSTGDRRPPGQFIVDTPSATATDLGCAYTLHVDEDGRGC